MFRGERHTRRKYFGALTTLYERCCRVFRKERSDKGGYTEKERSATDFEEHNPYLCTSAVRPPRYYCWRGKKKGISQKNNCFHARSYFVSAYLSIFLSIDPSPRDTSFQPKLMPTKIPAPLFTSVLVLAMFFFFRYLEVGR